MTTYHTRNPLGSTEPKDLFDNAENLDHRENDLENEEWEDRFGRSRLTWHGIEKRHERQQEKFNDDFQQFLLNSGYEDLGDYDEGIAITARNQVFRYDGELYRASAALELPYTTTGVWSEESALFVAIGDGVLRQELAKPDGASKVGIVGADGNIYTLSQLAEALGGAIVGFKAGSIADTLNGYATLEQYGGKADYWLPNGSVNPNPTDNYPAFMALVADRLVQMHSTTNRYPSVGAVRLRAGGYYFSQPLSLKVVIDLEGVGTSLAEGYATVLLFPGNGFRGEGECSGITIHGINTDYTTTDLVPSTTGASGSRIANLSIRAINNVAQPDRSEIEQRNCGLWLRARAHIENVDCERWGGHGFMVVAGSGAAPRGNANLWRLIDCNGSNNGYHGLFVAGSDVNAGYAIGFNAVSNDGNGIKDNSFLGNTYIACHTSLNYRPSHYCTYKDPNNPDVLRWWWCQDPDRANTTEPGTDNEVWYMRADYTATNPSLIKPWSPDDTYELAGCYVGTNANSTSRWFGCYGEGGSQGPAYMYQRNIVLGGPYGAGVAPHTLIRNIVQRSVSDNAGFANLVLFDAYYGNGAKSVVFHPGPNTIRHISSPDNMPGAGTVRETFGVIGDTQIVFGYSPTGSTPQSGFALANTGTDTHGIARNDLYTSQGLRVGGASGASVLYGSPSSSRYYRRGTILIQTPTTTGDNALLVCTVAGIGGSTAEFKPIKLS